MHSIGAPVTGGRIAGQLEKLSNYIKVAFLKQIEAENQRFCAAKPLFCYSRVTVLQIRLRVREEIALHLAIKSRGRLYQASALATT
jgi:hypothetical protein